MGVSLHVRESHRSLNRVRAGNKEPSRRAGRKLALGGERHSSCRHGRTRMAKKASGGVYRVTEIIDNSKTTWEDAAKNAVETASKTLRDLHETEERKHDKTEDNGKVSAYRARVS